MIARLLALPAIAAASIATMATAQDDVSETTVATYVPTVDPDAFGRAPLEERKTGVTVDPAAVRMIVPGLEKFSIYRLIGPPHFGEGITRRWNYVLFFPLEPGSMERVRCRMEIRFEKPKGRYHVVVSEVVWKDQACADRVAAAG
ncbi:outer membrane protein assembly factor BamE [Pelagerythrobacter marensis]|uniref:SmpA / OmlA family n=1 Tax=Pelagerythrobacter marensis TaxID=543877 RepID=A0A0G3X4A7_9SPHN|nr:outer membrane protein assembly factor BamE [Pelagerythrobacter marensis]AKM06380.1 SmpA / OmlA family [Pelagerythrobacter marensis]